MFANCLFSLHACIKSQDFLMNTNCLFMSRCWLFCFRCMPALNPRIFLWTCTVCLYRAMEKQANILRTNFRLVIAGSRMLHNRTNDFEWRSIFRIVGLCKTMKFPFLVLIKCLNFLIFWMFKISGHVRAKSWNNPVCFVSQWYGHPPYFCSLWKVFHRDTLLYIVSRVKSFPLERFHSRYIETTVVLWSYTCYNIFYGSSLAFQ
jgi:hypothetical protein